MFELSSVPWLSPGKCWVKPKTWNSHIFLTCLRASLHLTSIFPWHCALRCQARPQLWACQDCTCLIGSHVKPTEGTGYNIIFQGTYLKMPQSQREKNPRCYQKLHNSLSVLMPTKVGANIFWQPYNGPICVHPVYNQANKAVHHIYY